MDGTQPDDEVRRARETRWLRDIARGGAAGRDALDRLVAFYDRKVIGVCWSLGRLSRAETEDVLQTFALRVFERARDFRIGETPSAWLMRIACNLVRDVQRDILRARRQDLGEDAEEAMDRLIGADPARTGANLGLTVADCVRRVLPTVARLHPEETMALAARHMEGWDIDELAEHLGRSETATRTFLHAARLKFRDHFRPCLDLLTD